MEKDRLFTNENFKKSRFLFDKKVVSVFDDMINRSVPCFSMIHCLILDFCLNYFFSKKLSVLDLGCSTGSFLKFLLHHELKNKYIHYTGIDESEYMIKKLNLLFSNNENLHVNTKVATLTNLENFPASNIVLLNLVLQFIPIDKRFSIVKNIFDCLNEDGVLFLVEKINFKDKKMQSVARNVYHNFKSKNGYSMDEILNKENALNDVLIPQTLFENQSLLEKAGFSYVSTFFQWMNFVGFIAKK